MRRRPRDHPSDFRMSLVGRAISHVYSLTSLSVYGSHHASAHGTSGLKAVELRGICEGGSVFREESGKRNRTSDMKWHQSNEPHRPVDAPKRLRMKVQIVLS